MTPLAPTAAPVSGPSSSSSSSNNGLNAGAIAGIVIGGVVFLALLGGAVWYFFVREKDSTGKGPMVFDNPISVRRSSVEVIQQEGYA